MSILHKYRATLAYDGTAYLGWQSQAEGDTIQDRLEGALARMAKTPIRVTGAGRTDAGVHALGQVAHFSLPRPIPEGGLVRGLNSLLPADIRVLEVATAPADFHARYSARAKTYRYHLELGPVSPPFRTRFAHHHPWPLAREGMDRGAAYFVGEHDFSAFRAAACRAKSSVRRCTVSRWLDVSGELVYEVTANGFLHHMVRNMVGTLLEVGRAQRSSDSIPELITSRDRRRAGPTAPARGLCLVRVDYPLS